MANGGKITYTVGFNTDLSGLKKVQDALAKMQNLATLNIKDSGTDAEIKKLAQDLAKAKDMADNVERALTKSFNVKLGTTDINKFTQELTQTGLTLKDISDQFAKIGPEGNKAFSTIMNQLTKMDTTLYQTSNVIDKLASSFKNIVTYQLNTSIYKAILSTLGDAVSYTKELDKSLNNIRIVTGKSKAEMDNFAKSANAAAKALGATTTDYTNASLIYFQQGLDAKTVEKYTDVTLKAMNVTGQTAEQVSEQLTAVWNGYKVTNDEAEAYIDKLAAVAATSASNLEELSTAMSKVAATASTVGVDIDDLTAQISTIVSVTRQAPESVGTALKTIYARIGDLKIDGTTDDGTSLGQVSGQMKQLGIDVLDQTGNLREMSTIIEEVAEKWQTWSIAQKQAAAIAMAGKRQYTMLMSLFENWDMHEKEMQIAADSLGTLNKQQQVYASSLEAMQNKLKASKEALQMDILSADNLQTYYEILDKIITKVDSGIHAFGGIAEILKTIAPLMLTIFSKNIVSSVGNMVSNFELFNAKKAQTQQIANLTKAGSFNEEFQGLNFQTSTAYAASSGLITKDEIEQRNNLTSQYTEAYEKLKNLRSENENFVQQEKEILQAFNEQDGSLENIIDKLRQREDISGATDDDILNASFVKAEDLREEIAEKTATEADVYAKEGDEGIARLRQEIEKLKVQLKGLPTKQLDFSPALIQTNRELKIAEQHVKTLSAQMLKLQQKDNLKLLSKGALQMAGSFAMAQQTFGNLASTVTEATASGMEFNEAFSRITMQLTVLAPAIMSAVKGFHQFVIGYNNYKLTSQASALIKDANNFSKLTVEIGGTTASIKDLTVQQIKELEGKDKLSKAQKAAILANLQEAKAKIQNQLATKELTAEEIALLEAKLANITAQEKSIFSSLGGLGKGFTQTTIAITAVVAAIKIAQATWQGYQKAKANAAAADSERLKKEAEVINKEIDGYKQLQEYQSKLEDGSITIGEYNSKLVELSIQYGISTEAIKNATEEYGNEAEAIRNLIALKEKDATTISAQGAEKDIEKLQYETYSESTIFEGFKRKYGNGTAGIGNFLVETGLGIGPLGAVQQSVQGIGELLEKTGVIKHHKTYKELREDDANALYDSWEKSAKEIAKNHDIDFDENAIDKIKEGNFGGIDSRSFAAIVAGFQSMSSMYDNDIYDYWSSKFGNADVTSLLDAVDEETEANINQAITQQTSNITNWKDYQTKISAATKELNSTQYSSLDEAGKRSIVESKVNNTRYLDIAKTTQRLVDSGIINQLQYTEAGSLLENYKDNYTDFYEALQNENLLDLLPKNADFDVIQQIAEGYQKIADSKQTLTDINTALEASGKDPSKLNEEELESINRLLEKYPELAYIRDTTSEQYINKLKEIRELEEQNHIQNAISALQDQVEIAINIDGDPSQLEHTLNNILQHDYELQVAIKTDIDTDIAEIEDAMSSLQNVISEIGDDFIIDSSSIKELQKVFPNILENAKITAEGKIALDKEVVKSAIDTAKTETLADTEQLKSKIKNEQKEAQARADKFKKIADLARQMAKAQTDSSIDSTELQVQLQDALQEAGITTSELMGNASEAFYTNSANDATESIKAQINAINEFAKAHGIAIAEAAELEEAFQNKEFDRAKELAANITQSIFSGYSPSGNQEAAEYGKMQESLTKINDIIDSSYYEKMADNAQAAADSWQAYADSLGKTYDELLYTSTAFDKMAESAGSAAEETELLLDNLHDINNELSRLSNELDEIQQQEKKLTSENLINNLNKQVELNKQLATAQKQKLELIKAEAGVQKATLESLGATFNKNGSISNYSELLGQYSNNKEKYDKVSQLIQDYDSNLLEKIPEAVKQNKQYIEKGLEAAIKGMKVNIEMDIDKESLEKQYNDFLNKVSEDDDYQVRLNLDIDNVKNSQTLMNSLQKYVNDVQKEVVQIQQTGWSNIYGDDYAQALKDLEDGNKKLQTAMTDYIGEIKQAKEEYKKLITTTDKAFETQSKNYEKIGKYLDHDIKLIELISGSTAYDSLSRIYDQKIASNSAQLENARAEAEYWKKMMDSVAEDSEFYDIFRENWQSAMEDVNSTLESTLDTLGKNFANNLKETFQNFENEFAGGSLKFMTQDWELEKKNANMYLDQVNKAFEISKLKNKYQEQIDKAGVNAQQKITSLMNQQIKYLEEKENLTKYDVERAQKVYDLQVAQMALEDARRNKNTAVLKRDSQGNYSYQYVADEDAIGDAQQKVDELSNSLFNYDKDAYTTNLDAVASLITEAEEKIQSVMNDTTVSLEVRQQRAAEIYKQYNELITNTINENAVIRENLLNSSMDEIANYQLSVITEQLVPGWDGGIQQMIDKINGEGGFEEVFNKVMDDCNFALEEYSVQITDACDKAGVDYNSLKEDGVDPLVDSTYDLVDETDKLLQRYTSLTTVSATVVNALNDITSSYNTQKQSVMDTIAQVESLLEKQANAAEFDWDSIVNDAVNAGQAISDYFKGLAEEDYTPGGTPEKTKVNLNQTGNNEYVGITSDGTTIIHDGKSTFSSIQEAKDYFNNSDKYELGNIKERTGEKANIPKAESGVNTPTFSSVGMPSNNKSTDTGFMLTARSGEKAQYSSLGQYIGSNSGFPLSISSIRRLARLEESGNTFIYTPSSNLEYNMVRGVGRVATLIDPTILFRGLKNDNLGSIQIEDFTDREEQYKEWDEKTLDEYMNKYGIMLKKFDTGGYTGNWNSSSGKLAMLHEKELVLNKQDTSNILLAVTAMREAMQMAGNRMMNASMIQPVVPTSVATTNNATSNVTINADFPNVTSRTEIEEAFNNLVNYASQQALKKFV